MLLVKEHIDDIYYFDLLNESLNEDLNIEKIKEIIKNISSKDDIISRLIKRFNESRNIFVKKNIATILIVLFLGNFAIKNSRWSINYDELKAETVPIENIANKLSKDQSISIEKIKKETSSIYHYSSLKYVNLTTAKISNDAKDFIKHHEKLSLKAYAIGDDMITIGYGHASPAEKSKYKVGDVITQEKANQLFTTDIHTAEEGVKRIIHSWNKPKIENKITQGMFDAMVSMAYNMGITRLHQTHFMRLIKNDQFKEAAEKLKTTNIKSIVNQDGQKLSIEMPGLKNRRAQEHKLFVSR